jgi:hypothetical protein
MKHIDPNISARVRIDSATTVSDIHDQLARQLEFPDFYKQTPAMLNDSLRAINKTARITFELADELGEATGPAYRLITIVARVAFENPNLVVTITHAGR